MKLIKIYPLFFVLNMFSQKGEIEYKAYVKTNKIEYNSESDSLTLTQKKYIDNYLKKQKEGSYLLIFNENESLFKKKESIYDENKMLNLAEIRMKKGTYYRNRLLKQTILNRKYSGEFFLIHIPDFQWKLTQEKKKIDKYTCYKATTIKYSEGRSGIIKRKVTAWYTTQIPYNFGPKDYNGLPGLILELKEDNLVIKASKININLNKRKIINKPNSGEKVTLQQYDSIVKEMYYNRRRRN